MAKKITRRELLNLQSELENERSSFESHWRDLADFFLPRRAQFTVTNTNRGDKRNQKIINSTGPLAVRTLRAGMMSGITSPARPWFRITTPDPELAEQAEIKLWLHTVFQRMNTVFIRSNLYNVLPIVYGDLGTFSVSAMFVEEDFEDVIRCHAFPIGSYSIANDEKGRIRVFFREFRLTVRQLTRKFGMDENGKIDWSIFSTHIKDLYDNNNLDAWIDVCHAILPNTDYDDNGLSSNQKKFRSIYFEKGSGSDQNSGHIDIKDDKFLSDKGYDEFRLLAPRWEVTGEDSYGTSCPGMLSLGDTKALQTMEKRKAQAIEKQVNPPMKAPSLLKTQKASILPGDITYTDEREGQQGFSPVHEVNPNIGELNQNIREHEDRIKRGYFEDLFLLLSTLDRKDITATEVIERKEEKLLALGPVLEQLNQDLLDPLIDITFATMAKQGLIPEPPEALAGLPLKVEYISIMHQAQKSAGLASIDRFVTYVGNAAQFDPSALDKLDIDQSIDVYADITGVNPEIVRSDEAVQAIRVGRQQLEQQQAQLEALQQGASAAKDLSQAEVGGQNALDALVQQSEAGAIQ
jgi:hypothetical protein